MDDLPEREKIRATTSREDKAILKLFKADSQLSLRNSKRGFEKETQEHMEKRMAWAAVYIGMDWSNAIFTNELSFLNMDTLQVCLVSS